MDQEDEILFEEFYKNVILKNKEEETQDLKEKEEDNRSEISYNSEENDFDFSELEQNQNINLTNEEKKEEPKSIHKEKVKTENILWKYKKIDQYEKLLDKFYITEEGLLILKNLPKFEELTDEQKFYEMKKKNFKLYENTNFDKTKYEKNNQAGLFAAGDGRLNKKKNRNKLNPRNILVNNNNNNNNNNAYLINNLNFMPKNLKRKNKN